ncbi:MAG: hypothetical protein U0807_08435 [Candidatus Binatia bacterium]
MATLEDEEAKKQVQEAVWQWTLRVIVLAVTFGFGFFAAWVQWGSGEMGAPALRDVKTQLEAQVLELKNKRVETEGKVVVLQTRLEECQKNLNKAAAGGGAAN